MHYKFLEKYYFIDKFNKENINKLDKNTVIIYRNYSKKIDKKLLIKLRDYLKKKKLKFILSNNIKIAIQLNLDGAYFPSFNKNYRHLSYHLKKKFILLGSAHNINEINIKKIQSIEKIFLSSLFKKNNNYLGLNKFNLLQKFTDKKIIALGGISKKNIKKIKLTSCIGFAGISYFAKKKAP